MPDPGRVDMADSWSTDIQREITCPPAPALKKVRELISRGRKANGGIMPLMNYQGFAVSIRPPKWKDASLRLHTKDHQAAQYVADALFHYVGRPPVHFPEADFRYPPLFLNTGEYLNTREKCSAYVAKIAKGSALRCARKDFKVRVQKLILEMAKRPEVVQFLNSLRKRMGLLLHLDPSLKEDLTIHQVEASDMMLVQDLLTHVQPEQVEEASFDSSYNWKKRHRILDPVAADLPSSADCLEELGKEPNLESEAMDTPTDEEVLSGESGALLEFHTEIASADSHGPRTEPSRKRSAASAFYDDNLFAQIRSYVKQQIEEALLPLMSALRSREEDEHKHRQKMLALEQEKLALMRQKLECLRRSNAVPASVAK